MLSNVYLLLFINIAVINWPFHNHILYFHFPLDTYGEQNSTTKLKFTTTPSINHLEQLNQTNLGCLCARHVTRWPHQATTCVCRLTGIPVTLGQFSANTTQRNAFSLASVPIAAIFFSLPTDLLINVYSMTSDYLDDNRVPIWGWNKKSSMDIEVCCDVRTYSGGNWRL